MWFSKGLSGCTFKAVDALIMLHDTHFLAVTVMHSVFSCLTGFRSRVSQNNRNYLDFFFNSKCILKAFNLMEKVK